MAPDIRSPEVEAKARDLYEGKRKAGCRDWPVWDAMSPESPRDMGLKCAALAHAREVLTPTVR